MNWLVVLCLMRMEKRMVFIIKEITKEEINILIDRKIISNSSKGFTDKRGHIIGFYRTRNKRYIEDKYVNLAQKFLKV